ncbi:MAG TPA: FHA domain-containing protein [Planctomycetota bacterium]|nr:FHA domain-containing protein [Planctomycetota bacterium]
MSELLRGEQFSFDGDQPISIGRTTDNTLPLDHKSVSRRHARIEADDTGYVLLDLGSHNGTRVGDKLVSKQRLQSGDVIGLGEILVKFVLVDDDAATEGMGGGNLPVVAAAVAQAAALARPMTFEDVFVPGGATTPVAGPKARRNFWPAIYALGMVLVVVLGLAAFWAVGVRPIETPRVDVLVRANESLPVDLSRLPAPEQRGWMRGLSRIQRIGTPADQQVADARTTLFHTLVSVRGKSPGSTDIPVYGPPLGEVILRVVVRGAKPPPEAADPGGMSVADRRAFGHRILQKADTFVIGKGSVNSYTWGIAKELDLAARLLEPIPNELTHATRASQMAHELRKALNRRFDQLAREIDILREQGKYPEALARALELRSLFPDPESEEHLVVNLFYEGLVEEAARAEREAQEKR